MRRGRAAREPPGSIFERVGLDHLRRPSGGGLAARQGAHGARIDLDGDHAGGAFEQQRAGQAAGAGADLDHACRRRAAPAARAMRRVRLRSSRKCWPKRLRASSPCGGDGLAQRRQGRRAPSIRQRSARRRAMSSAMRERGDQARRIGAAGAGDVERGAVVGRGAHEGQAERDVDAAGEVDRLDRDQRLVVIHAERRVIGRARGGDGTACRPARARGRRCPRRAASRSPGAITRISSSPIAPCSPACGLSAGDGQPRPRDAEQRLEAGGGDAAGPHDDRRAAARAPRRRATGGW